MNILKEAQSFIGFASYCPLLYKATSDDEAATPGYLYEEIIKISFQSNQHRIHLVDFLIDKLLDSGWRGKQKVLQILLQLSKKGHCGIRILLRKKDGEIRKGTSCSIALDPLLVNSPQSILNSSLQELLTYLFDPEIITSDNESMQKGDNQQPISNVSRGYGSSNSNVDGKYNGFGNTTIDKKEGLVNQVCDMVGKIVSSSEKESEMKKLLATDKGSYQPIPNTSFTSPLAKSLFVPTQNHVSGPPMFSSYISSRSKGHIAGKVGGGWASDDEDEMAVPLEELSLNFDRKSPSLHLSDRKSCDDFINEFLSLHSSWPVNHGLFLKAGSHIQNLHPEELLKSLMTRMHKIVDLIFENSKDSVNENIGHDVFEVHTSPPNFTEFESNIMIILLFIELSYYNAWLPITFIHKHCFDTLSSLSTNKILHKFIRAKAQKIGLILKIYLNKNTKV